MTDGPLLFLGLAHSSLCATWGVHELTSLHPSPGHRPYSASLAPESEKGEFFCSEFLRGCSQESLWCQEAHWHRNRETPGKDNGWGRLSLTLIP